MRPGSFKPSHRPALFTTRAVLSGSADNFSINSATVIAPSLKVTPEPSANTAAVQRILPPPALDFCTAANETEQAAIDHSRYFQQAGTRVTASGAQRLSRTTPQSAARFIGW